MPQEAGADGNGCDRREVCDWRSRVLAKAVKEMGFSECRSVIFTDSDIES